MQDLLETAEKLDHLCRQRMEWMERNPYNFDSDTWDACEALTYTITRFLNARKDI